MGFPRTCDVIRSVKQDQIHTYPMMQIDQPVQAILLKLHLEMGKHLCHDGLMTISRCRANGHFTRFFLRKSIPQSSKKLKITTLGSVEKEVIEFSARPYFAIRQQEIDDCKLTMGNRPLQSFFHPRHRIRIRKQKTNVFRVAIFHGRHQKFSDVPKPDGIFESLMVKLRGSMSGVAHWSALGHESGWHLSIASLRKSVDPTESRPAAG